jgi:ABC-type nitrate/sulfonate/bicarbonate transport system ATPase subunit
MQELLLDTWEAARKTVLFVTPISTAIFMANRVVVFSARPGRIKCEVATDLPIPAITIKTSAAFIALKARLTGEIRVERWRRSHGQPRQSGVLPDRGPPGRS